MDAFALQAIAGELSEVLSGARLDRISQADAHTIVLFFSGARARGRRLLVSADPAFPRVHLAADPPASLPEAPAFCRALRKRLVGSRLTRAAAGEWERVLQFSFERRGGAFALMAEMMGRWSNLILLKGATGEILEVLRPAPRSRNPRRPLERGGRYRLPPPQEKANPDALTPDAIRKMFEESNLRSAAPEEFARWLVRSVGGLSPAVARELARASRADEGWAGAADALTRVILGYRRREFAPAWVLGADGSPVGLSAVRIPGAEPASRRAFGSMNEAADAFYEKILRDARLEERKKGASRILRRARERVRRAIDAAREDAAADAEAGDALRKGELLLERLDEAGEARVLRVLDGDDPVEIALDPRLTPSANAQRYFRRYKKLKRRASSARARLREMESEEAFVEGLTFDLEAADDGEGVSGVEEALARAGVPVRREEAKPGRGGGARGRRPAPARRYRRFLSPSGWEVIVGKNAMGNEELLRRVGRRSDTWLHARDAPGSHALLRRAEGAPAEPDEETLVQAAAFAAYFSRGRADSKLPVAWLPFASLRRPKGARPGQVLLGAHRTILVDPALGERLCGEWEEVS